MSYEHLRKTWAALWAYPQARRAFFGFDFKHEKVCLLEAKHGPCFPIDENHPLQKTFYEPFWQTVVEEIIEPLAFSLSTEAKQFLKI